jgi:hypothetical protein
MDIRNVKLKGDILLRSSFICYGRENIDRVLQIAFRKMEFALRQFNLFEVDNMLNKIE